MTAPTTLRQRAGKCPGCGAGLFADVVIAVEVGTPYFQTDGKPTVHAQAIPVSARIEHACSRNEDDA